VVGKVLNYLEVLFFLLLIILPAPLFGGRDATALFLIRVLILGTFILFLPLLFFRRNDYFLQAIVGIKFPLLLFCLFILYCFLQWHGGSAVFSRIKPGSICGFETKDNAVQLIFYLLFFLLSLHFFSSQKRIHLVMILVAIETAFLIVLGYFQSNINYGGLRNIYGWFQIPQQALPFSSFLNKNYYAGFLLLASHLFIGPLLYWLRDPKIKLPFNRHLENFFFALLLAAVLVSIFYVQARAVIVMELCVIALLWFFSILRGIKKKRILLALLLFGGSICALGFVLKPFILEKFAGANQDLMSRFTAWKESIPLFLNFPYFGTGLGAFKWISRLYQIHWVEIYWWTHVNNDYLELLTDTGMVGFLVFMTAIVLLLIFSLWKCLKSGSRWNRTVGSVSFMAAVSLGIITTIDFYLRTPAIAMLFIVHLGILVNCGVMYSRKDGERPLPGTRSTSLKILLIIATIIPLCFLGRYATRAWQSARTFDRYKQYQVLSDRDFQAKKIQLGELVRAVSIMPDDPRGWKLLGDIYSRKVYFKDGRYSHTNFRKSIEAYKILTERAPTRPDAWLDLGTAEIKSGDWQAGFENMRRGLSLSPYNRDIYLYTVVNYLWAAEILSESKEQSDAYIQQATAIIEKASSLKRPFTLEDYDYIGGEGGKLSEEERLRVYTLLKHMPALNIHKSF